MAEQKSGPPRWHGIALDRQVLPALSHPVVVQGEMLALWRGGGEQDPVQVWEDRCPHRGMRLSFGYVRENVLHCIYHSWGFRADGQCAQIPAHPDLPPPKSVRTAPYPAHSRYGIVWTCLDRHPASPEPHSDLLPDLACSPHDWEPVRSLYVNASAARLAVALAGFDFGQPVRVVQQQDDVLLLAREDGLELLVALQAVSDCHSGLHMVARKEVARKATMPDSDNTLTIRRQLAQRLQRLRHQLETASA